MTSDGEKVLGVNWNTLNDSFSFNLKEIATKRDENDVVTKRSISKLIASMYDPLGVVSHIMAKAEIYL